MSRPPNRPRRYGTLKAAVSHLVELCGGLKAAAEIARVGRSQLHRYTDDSDEHADCHMPVDIVRALERSCGETPVTEWMAYDAGGSLFRVDPTSANDALDVDFAKLATEFGELLTEFGKAKSDGQICEADKARMLREAHDVLRAVLCGIIPDLLPADPVPSAAKPALKVAS